MEHIRQTLSGVIQAIAEKRSPESEGALAAFEASLSARERKHVKCAGFKAGVLTVNVDSSAWLYQFSLKKEDLVKKTGLKNIRFRIGEIK